MDALKAFTKHFEMSSESDKTKISVVNTVLIQAQDKNENASYNRLIM